MHLLLLSGTSLCVLCELASASTSLYQLAYDYTTSPATFFDSFDFFDAADPTSGFVEYLSRDQAGQDRLIGYADAAGRQAPYIGVDSWTLNPPSGRASVRLTSRQTYGPGTVIVADIAHMPQGCGTWPAFWMLGSQGIWPASGEIDIIEGINNQVLNSMSLHTTEGCTVQNSGFKGDMLTDDCWISAPDQSGNQGCQILASGGAGGTFGEAFNAALGGTYVTQWTEDGINIWFASGSSLPAASLPNIIEDLPATLGMPMARFAGSGCNFDSHFYDMNIVIDTTLCGSWAGQPVVWQESCAASTGAATCEEWVAANPGAFAQAYWLFRGLRVYSRIDASPTTLSEIVANSTTSNTSTIANAPHTTLMATNTTVAAPRFANSTFFHASGFRTNILPSRSHSSITHTGLGALPAYTQHHFSGHHATNHTLSTSPSSTSLESSNSTSHRCHLASPTPPTKNREPPLSYAHHRHFMHHYNRLERGQQARLGYF